MRLQVPGHAMARAHRVRADSPLRPLCVAALSPPPTTHSMRPGPAIASGVRSLLTFASLPDLPLGRPGQVIRGNPSIGDYASVTWVLAQW